MAHVEALARTRLSRVALSNLYTKGVACKHDPRQEIPHEPKVPDAATRKLLAELVAEEAMETIRALGFRLTVFVDHRFGEDKYLLLDGFHGPKPESLENIIDRCCDLQYVASGVLAACGVADLEHLKEVCLCNEAKFPNGAAVIDGQSGKYLKPPGWVGPDHTRALSHSNFSLKEVSQILVANGGV